MMVPIYPVGVEVRNVLSCSRGVRIFDKKLCRGISYSEKLQRESGGYHICGNSRVGIELPVVNQAG